LIGQNCKHKVIFACVLMSCFFDRRYRSV